MAEPQALVPNPLRRQRLKVSEDGLSASLSKPWTRALVLGLGGLWNLLVFALLSWRGLDAHAATQWWLAAPLLGGFGLLAYAVREALFRVHYSFRGGMFQVQAGPLALLKSAPTPLSEIRGFGVVAHSPEPFEIQVRLHSGKVYKLLAPLDGVILRLNGGAPIAGTAPASAFLFVADWLSTALDQAKHSGGLYRVAPGQLELREAVPAAHEPAAASPASAPAHQARNL